MKDEFFNEDIHPEDMDFEIVLVGSNKYKAVLEEYRNWSYESLLTNDEECFLYLLMNNEAE